MADELLNGYRQSIDNIDAALIHMLAERFKVTQAVGRHKATHGLPAAATISTAKASKDRRNHVIRNRLRPAG